ncbi:SAM-dependent methyltransferase [Luedemannella helvata]|uniref:SAM-dependent methyltransferase n=1 Tax=Luedemannella helvata TaxID=349315 RepID=A0ABP4WB45_9ACTN
MSEPVIGSGPDHDGVITMEPIGQVVGGRGEPYHDHWAPETAVIRIRADRFTPAAIVGLAEFSHLEVVFFFDKVDPDAIEYGARHPRGNTDWPKVGIFAHRGPNRPNRIGVSRCALLAVDGLDLHVGGLDAIDGTPVLDVKPYISGFGPRGEVREPAWAEDLMRVYY